MAKKMDVAARLVAIPVPTEGPGGTISFACLESLGRPEVATYVRVLRHQLGWTQQDLADNAGLPQPTISKLENAPEDCSLEVFLKVASAFGITIYDLAKEPAITVSNGRSRRLRPRDVTGK